MFPNEAPTSSEIDDSVGTPARFLELICPGGFEEYFFEMAGPFNARDAVAIATIRDRYRHTVKLESIPELLERHGLQPPF